MDGPGDLSDDALSLWDAARALNAAALARNGGRVSLPPLLFFTDPARTPRPWETAARLPSGAAVIYRHFGAADAGETARRLRAVTSQRGVWLLIGLDGALAEAVEADGVHLPERALDQGAGLRMRRPDWLLTGAVHSVEAAANAPRELDAVVLSPVFAAGGSSGSKTALGTETLARAVRTTIRPVYALGGINTGSLDQLTGTGACGIGGVDGFQRAFASPTVEPKPPAKT